MARPRSSKTDVVKAKLISRIRDGFYRAGDRFLSNRAIADQFAISYQTADRLIRELVDEGLLLRRRSSGTYIPGDALRFRSVQMIFHERARRAGSFGARLLEGLSDRLTREGVPFDISFEPATMLQHCCQSDILPVLWESPDVLRACMQARHSAILLNDRPPVGLGAIYIDSVSIDDFAGGAFAAELLLQQIKSRQQTLAVVAGPAGDTRSQERVRGFLSRSPATVLSAGSWYKEAGLLIAPRVLRRKPGGVFCCNDRLAEALMEYCHNHSIPCPPLVGFDNAPVAEELSLTTIAIPWPTLWDEAATLIRRRYTSPRALGQNLALIPQPILRHISAA